MEKLFTGSEAMFQVRTDLALETREKFDEDHIEVKGVRVDEERISPEIMITRVFIDTENGAISATVIMKKTRKLREKNREHLHNILSALLGL